MPQIETDITPEREHEIMTRVTHFQESAITHNADLMARMEKAQRYTAGDQWDPTIKEANTKRAKFSLTIPLIRPQVKQLVGYYIQNPKDPSIRAYRGGLRVLADLITALVMHATKDESVQFEIAQTVDECGTTGRSYMAMLLDYERDPMFGDLEIKKLDCFDVWPDPACKEYDPNNRHTGAKFMIWRPWVDKDWIKAKWPDKAQRLGIVQDAVGGGGAWSWFGQHVNWLVTTISGRRMTSVGSAYGGNSEEMVFSRFKDRLDHTWWIEYKPIYYWYDLRDERPEAWIIVTDEEKQQAEQAAEQFPDTFKIEESIAPVMNHTVSLGSIFLENSFDELNLLASGQTLYPIVPFNCFFNNGYISGVAEDLIGSQDWVNLTRSTVANILKKQPNHGYMIGDDKEGTFKDWLAENGGLDGVVIDKSRGGGFVEAIKPPPLPAAHAQMTELAKAEMREISNLRTEQPEGAAKEGWQTVSLKQQASLTGVSPVLSNIDYSLHLLYNLIATSVRSLRVYSNAEIRRIVDEKDLIDPQLLQEAKLVAAQALGVPYPIPPIQMSQVVMMQMDPGDSEMIQKKLHQLDMQREALEAKLEEIAKPLAIDALIDALHNSRTGRYECTAATATSSPTFRMAQFGQLMELQEYFAKTGQMPIPQKYIIDASDLPNKDEILEDMEMAQQAQQNMALAGAGAGAK